MIIQTSSNRLHFQIQWLLCSLMCYQTMRAHAILHIACRTFYGRSRQRGFLRRVLRWLLYTIRSNTIQSVSMCLCVCVRVFLVMLDWKDSFEKIIALQANCLFFLFVIVDLSGWKESLLLKLFYLYVSVYQCLSLFIHSSSATSILLISVRGHFRWSSPYGWAPVMPHLLECMISSDRSSGSSQTADSGNSGNPTQFTGI